MLFACSFLVRMRDAGGSGRLYFKGESATHYRYAYMLSKRGRLPRVDRKAQWPEGFAPVAVKAQGTEFLSGYLYRIVGYFSDMSEKEFVRMLTALLASLMVFPVFSISYRLWRCQAGGLLAAFLTAFSFPLIAAGGGREFDHMVPAALLVAVHLLLFLGYLRRRDSLALVLQGMTAFSLVAVWEFGIYYLALYHLLIVFSSLPPRERSKHAMISTAVLVASAVLLPYFRHTGLIVSLPSVLIVASTAYTAWKRERVRLFPGLLYVLAGGALLVFFLRPLAGGTAPTSTYLFERVTHPAGKPPEPASLSPTTRYLWNWKNSSPGARELLAFFLPLLLLSAPLVGGLRSVRKERHVRILPAGAAALLSAALYVIDRNMVLSAGPAAFVFMSPACFALSKHLRRRIVFLGAALLLVFLQAVQPGGRADLLGRTADLLGMKAESGGRFTWVSVGNADLELVKFIAARTSVKDPVLATPEIASFLLGFTGRTALFVPGIESEETADKTCRLMSAFYGDESKLYSVCDSLGIKYVVYSIDILLDASRNSPAYLAGVEPRRRGEASLAYEMHFHPENLEYFRLVYENDNYRLFEVGKKKEPDFLSDHPPVYQHGILERHHDDLESFYDRTIRLISMYGLGVEAHKRGNYAEAASLFSRCLEEAPLFTRARIALASTLLALDRIEDAEKVFLSVIEYAPDNPDALYGTAFTLAKLGENERARTYLDILLSATRDREMIKKAKALRSHILRNRKAPAQ